MKINKDRIKYLIKKKSMKQKQVANELGVGPQDFNNWMFRGIFPHYDKLEQLADILEVDVRTLQTEKEFMEPLMHYEQSATLNIEQFIPYYEPSLEFALVNFKNKKTATKPKDYLHVPGVRADLFYPYFGQGFQAVSNGDIVGLRKINDLRILDFNQPYTICIGEQILWRYLRKSNKKDVFEMHEDDRFEKAQNIQADDIKALFEVAAVIKRTIN